MGGMGGKFGRKVENFRKNRKNRRFQRKIAVYREKIAVLSEILAFLAQFRDFSGQKMRISKRKIANLLFLRGGRYLIPPLCPCVVVLVGRQRLFLSAKTRIYWRWSHFLGLLKKRFPLTTTYKSLSLAESAWSRGSRNMICVPGGTPDDLYGVRQDVSYLLEVNPFH